MDIDLRKLRYFVALAAEQHFGRAAERLFIAQPVLSRQIRRLEEELGATLIERAERRFTLTAAGERLSLEGPALLAAADAALRVFETLEPGVTIDLRQIAWEEQADVLTDGRVDVALVRLPIAERDLVLVPLFREPRLAMLPLDHPLAKRDRISITQLADDPVLRHADAPAEWDAFSVVDPRPDGRSPRRGPAVRTYTEKLEQIAAGHAIAFSPASAAAAHVHPGVMHVPVVDIPPAEVCIAYREPAASALVTAFVEAALSAFPSPERAGRGAA